jgi:hypothetical protein
MKYISFDQWKKIEPPFLLAHVHARFQGLREVSPDEAFPLTMMCSEELDA